MTAPVALGLDPAFPRRLARVSVLRRGYRRARGGLARAADAHRSTALILGGLGALDAAAWTTWGLGAGLAAVGVSLLALDWLTGPDPDEPEAATE